MINEPTIGHFIDAEDRELIEPLELDSAVFKSKLTPARKKQIQDLAFNTMQEGMPYQTLINSILHKAVS